MAAGVEYRIDAREVDRVLSERLRRLPHVERAIEKRTAILVADAAKELAPADRGELRAKIAIVERRDHYRVESQAKYSLPVEKGSRPHAAPFSPIERWALRHGLIPGAVWTSIQRRGTKAHPFMRPAAKVGRQAFGRFAEEALRSWVG